MPCCWICLIQSWFGLNLGEIVLAVLGFLAIAGAGFAACWLAVFWLARLNENTACWPKGAECTCNKPKSDKCLQMRCSSPSGKNGRRACRLWQATWQRFCGARLAVCSSKANTMASSRPMVAANCGEKLIAGSKFNNDMRAFYVMHRQAPSAKAPTNKQFEYAEFYCVKQNL